MKPIEAETAIIGGGQAGVPLARALAHAGHPVVLFEREHLGGSCVNFGCTPSKAIIASARLAADVKHGGALGVHAAGVQIDFSAAMERAQRLANEGAEELDRGFAHDQNVRLIKEHARLEGRDGGFVIRAGDALVKAERVVLDTGNRTARPPIPGLADVPLITAENWITLRELPPQLILLGGSYIALEMAQAFQCLGSQVTVVQKADRLAEREDADVGDLLRQILEKDGCRVYLNADVQRVEAAGAGIRVHLPTEILEGSISFWPSAVSPTRMISALIPSASRLTTGVTSRSMTG
jgi:pyruvate/2-oxoglutarate dehydrogenase complex dihydrolipoamide dehydrogenase (E3) component